jgi:hypothetical protein
MKTHSLRQGTLASAQFFFFGNFPSQTKSMTLAPREAAISWVPSELPESTTTISSAKLADSMQALMLSRSFLVGIRTEMGQRLLTKYAWVGLGRIEFRFLPTRPKKHLILGARQAQFQVHGETVDECPNP